MTLREQRAIVYPPEYNIFIDEYYLYAPKKHKILLYLSTIWGCIYYGCKLIKYKIKEDLETLFLN